MDDTCHYHRQPHPTDRSVRSNRLLRCPPHIPVIPPPSGPEPPSRAAPALIAVPVRWERGELSQPRAHIPRSLARCRTASAPPAVPPSHSLYAAAAQPERALRAEKAYKKAYNEYQ